MSREKRFLKYFELLKNRPEAFAESSLINIIKDEKTMGEYEDKTGKKLGVIYDSPYTTLVVDLIEGENDGNYTYERILPKFQKGAIVAMVKCQDGFILLKQYRHAIRDFQYCFPRGFAEEDKSPEENVKKEISEEIGADVISIEKLGELTPDSGIMSNKVTYYLCEVNEFKLMDGYEGISEVVILNKNELEKWIREGRITDGFTVSAYGLYATR